MRFQAVLRKWRKLRLSNIPKTVLSMTMTLPLLPPDIFQEAIFIILYKLKLTNFLVNIQIFYNLCHI